MIVTRLQILRSLLHVTKIDFWAFWVTGKYVMKNKLILTASFLTIFVSWQLWLIPITKVHENSVYYHCFSDIFFLTFGLEKNRGGEFSKFAFLNLGVVILYDEHHKEQMTQSQTFPFKLVIHYLNNLPINSPISV